jgi:hypothetical protein
VRGPGHWGAAFPTLKAHRARFLADLRSAFSRISGHETPSWCPITGPAAHDLWIRSFDTVEELRQALLEFRGTYNATWLIERHEFRPPSAVRQDQLSTAALAVQAASRCPIIRGRYTR